MAYTHLTSEERHYIETRHKMKESTATTAEAVASSIITLLDGFKDWVHTLTFDNGKAFAKSVWGSRHLRGVPRTIRHRR